jgi:hypothetical protein
LSGFSALVPSAVGFPSAVGSFVVAKDIGRIMGDTKDFSFSL